MVQQQKLADYYAHHPAQMPAATWPSGGHFRAWRLEDFLADFELMGVYSRKDFFKVTLSSGPSTYHYAHQHLALAPAEPALVFTNTQIPYAWELPAGNTCQGYCCVFTEELVPTRTSARPADWPVFAPDRPSFFRLTPDQQADFARLFEQMLAEQDSDYPAKDELLYHYLMTCIHGALKLAPVEESRAPLAAPSAWWPRFTRCWPASTLSLPRRGAWPCAPRPTLPTSWPCTLTTSTGC